jgi:hypothetical protein
MFSARQGDFSYLQNNGIRDMARRRTGFRQRKQPPVLPPEALQQRYMIGSESSHRLDQAIGSIAIDPAECPQKKSENAVQENALFVRITDCKPGWKEKLRPSLKKATPWADVKLSSAVVPEGWANRFSTKWMPIWPRP